MKVILLFYCLIFFNSCDNKATKSNDIAKKDSVIDKRAELFLGINREIEAHPRDAKLFYERSLIYYEIGDTTEAQRDIWKAIEIDSGQADYYRMDGFYYYINGKDSLALERLFKSLIINKHNAETMTMIGNIYSLRKDYKVALEWYEKALIRNSDKADIHFNKCYVLRKMGRVNEGIKSCETALSYDSLFIKALNELFDIYLIDRQDTIKALGYNRRIEKQDSLHPLNNYNRGRYEYWLSQKQGLDKKQKDVKIKMAIEGFTKALNATPGFADAYYYRGFCLYEIGRYEDAMRDFQLAIITNPKDARAYFMTGSLYEYYQDYQKAMVFYEKTLSLDRNFKGAQTAKETVVKMLNKN